VRSRLTHHVHPAFGSRPIVSIRPSDVAAFASGLSTSLKPTSVRTITTTVTAVFRAAERDRIISGNPAEGVKLPSVERRQVTPLSAEQVYSIADNLPARYTAVAVVGTGLRPDELLGLQVGDIDFLRRTAAGGDRCRARRYRNARHAPRVCERSDRRRVVGEGGF
jgi:integrase